MNTQKTIKILAITSLLTTSALASASEMDHSHHKMEMNHDNHSGHNHELMSMNSDDEDSIYVCPMHPEVMSEEPSNCPICGMNLEKISFEEE